MNITRMSLMVYYIPLQWLLKKWIFGICFRWFTLFIQANYFSGWSFYYFQRKMFSIKVSVPKCSIIDLVRVLIPTRLGFCNSLCFGHLDVLLQKLQRIMNYACRLIFRLSPGLPILDFYLHENAFFLKFLRWVIVCFTIRRGF